MIILNSFQKNAQENEELKDENLILKEKILEIEKRLDAFFKQHQE